LKKATAIIPARYDSQRFPGKPLVNILGKPMIQRVYQQAKNAKSLNRIIIATDDERILKTSQSFGAEVYMTSHEHTSGTERAAETALMLNDPIIINIQGDEPLIKGETIDNIVDILQDDTIPMGTAAEKVKDMSLLKDKNLVKIVLDKNGFALYFSRSPIPHRASDFFFKHIGIYGYQRDFLLNFPFLKQSRLEITEKLEQLRVLENGYRIKVVIVKSPTMSVDIAEDVPRVEKLLKRLSE